jgi:hypothetical protein
VSCHQNVGQNHSLLIANKAFKNVAKFKGGKVLTEFTWLRIGSSGRPL